ncbi:hypothetical protein [Qipengyuania qiaonensis]|uniref:Uncharacterized protein n=1 Tax=Qipengyuania qiaonensis TaxID=2867240 RepID=A0ABS7J5V2_9SPHN|nr:hypothetical protein [Qipengyuania qiaonensis]MBX7481459.1 hypothetical protein [Qipengyuania qiaonensis]
MPRIPHVTRRDGRYVFRRRMHFRNIISKPLVISLRTADGHTARERAAVLSAHFVLVKLCVREMLQSGKELTEAEIVTLFRNALKERLRQHVRIAFEYGEWSDRALSIAADDREAYLTLRPTGGLDPDLLSVAKEILPDQDIEATLTEIGAPVTAGNVALARTHIFRARAAAGKRVQRLYDEEIMDAPDAVRALMADIDLPIQNGFGSIEHTSQPPANSSSDQRSESQFLIYDARRFGDVIEEILRELKAERIWKGDLRQQRRVIQTFAWITGNRELGSYDHRDVKAFKNGLLRLPKGFRYGTLTKGSMAQPFSEVVAALPPVAPGEGRNMKTLNRDLSYMNTVSKHLAESAWKPRHHDMLVLNFASNLARIVDKGIDPRPPWTTKHLELLFKSPLYVGG